MSILRHVYHKVAALDCNLKRFLLLDGVGRVFVWTHNYAARGDIELCAVVRACEHIFFKGALR